MSRLFPPAVRKPVLSLLAAALLALGAPVGGEARAESGSASADAITPVEDFSRQVEEFKKSYPELNKKIEESAKSIDAIADVEKARKEIEELRAAVAGMLGAVSDNGPVSQLGAKALAHARTKVKEIDRITTVTVSVLDRPPRCVCRNSASTDAPAN
ncbi:MAG: hypothetical protein ACXW3R_12205, partial [Rhodoplanes sp.]